MENKIDINSAVLEDFESLIGIGHAKAVAIIDARKNEGGFSGVNDLMKIPGIGPGILDPNRHMLVCNKRKKNGGQRKNDRRTRKSDIKVGAFEGSSKLTPGPSSPPVDHSPSPSLNVATRSRTASETALSGPTPRTSMNDLATPPNDRDNAAPAILDMDDSLSQGSVYLGEGPSQPVNNVCLEQQLMQCDLKADSDLEPSSKKNIAIDLLCSENISKEEEERENEMCLRSRMSHSALDKLDKHLMKRKSVSGLDNKAVSPGKKQCRTGSSNDSEKGLGLLDTLESQRRQQRLPLTRRKIPSKNNPPPELAQWLKTYQHWSHAERLLGLDELMQICEPTQVRHVMSVIEPQFQRDFISLLPKELALYVLSFLEPKDLCRAAQTCRYWRVLTEDNLLWREKCREERITQELVYGVEVNRMNLGANTPTRSMRRRSGSGAPTPSNTSSSSSSPLCSSPSTTPSSCTSANSSPCKVLYRRQHLIEGNWRHGEIRPPKVLRGHDDHVITCLEFCGNRIVSGSDDNTLKVWSAITGKCLRTLTGHTGGVWSSQMAGHIIISGSTDRTLKVWNSDTGQCIHTLYGHTSTVRCMHLHENKVVSGSRDATLRLWDVETGQCLHVLMGHVAAVRCVQYDGRRVVSGAYDYQVKVWDPETQTCLHTLQGHTNRVYSLQFDGKHIVSGSLDTSIRVWDVDTGNSLHTLIGHQSLTSGMELKDNILVSGNADSTVKVWDITTGKCLQTLQGPNKHQSAVTCLQFNRKFVITSSDDGTVKVWDLRTGEFIRNLVSLDSGGSGGVVWRIKCTNTKLVCAVGSRNGTEETKLQVLDFDVDEPWQLLVS